MTGRGPPVSGTGRQGAVPAERMGKTMTHPHTFTTGCISRLAVALAFGLAVAGAHAAVITVPGNWPTIQEAIDHANPGDTVLVSPGLYDENVDIYVEDLTLISTDGAGLTAIFSLTPPAPDLPVVLIRADGVTLGATGQGFQITQLQPGPAAVPRSGNAAVMIDGSTVGPDTVTVDSNVLIGSESDEGILVNPAIGGGHLVISNNAIQKGTGAAFSFMDGVYFHYTDFGGSVYSASLLGATVDFVGNFVEDFAWYGICVSEEAVRSTVNITDSDFVAYDSPNYTAYGIRLNEFSSVSDLLIENVTIDQVEYGIWAYGVENNSTAFIGPCTITGSSIGDRGIYVDDVYNFSSLTIDHATVSGFASEGILVYYAEAGSTATVTFCTVQGGSTGISVEEAYSGGTISIADNVVTGATDYGINVDYGADYGSSVSIQNNTVSGFAQAGIVFDEAYDGGYGAIDNNTLTANGGGALNGIEVDYVAYGSALAVRGNGISGVGDPNTATAGISVYQVRASNATVSGNTISAHAGLGSDYGIYFDYATESGSDLLVRNNEVLGFTQAGIEVDDVDDGSSAVIEDNTLTAHAGGAVYGIHVDYVDYQSTATISGNIIDGIGVVGITTAGIYLGEAYSGSTATISANTITANPTVGMGYGIQVDSGIEGGSDGLVQNNSVSGFTRAGIYVDEMDDGAHSIIANNMLTADAAGALYGIEVGYVDYGSSATVTANTIVDAGVGAAAPGAGIYLDEVYEGSVGTISGNTIDASGVTGAGDGVYLGYDLAYGSTLTVANNDVSGFSNANLYLQEVRDGSYLTVTGNTFDGGLYGVYCTTWDPNYPVIDEGSICEISQNEITGFSNIGLHFNGKILQSIVSIEENQLGGASAVYGVRFYNDIDEVSEVTVQDNTIWAFTDTGIYFDDVRTYSVVSALGNTITGDHAYNGIDFNEDIDIGSTVEASGNDISGYIDTGVRFYGNVANGSSASVLNNTITGVSAEYGVYFDYYVEYSSDATVSGNTISGFEEAGIYSYDGTYDHSSFTMADNVITGDPGSEYGIYYDYYVEWFSSMAITGNTISGVSDGGILFYDLYEDSDLRIDNNTVSAGPGYDGGIYVGYIEYDSTGSISGNTVTVAGDPNYPALGIYVYNIQDDTIADISSNTVTADPPGPGHGIYTEYVEYDADTIIEDNYVSGFDDACYYLQQMYDTYVGLIGNDFNGAAYGVYVEAGYPAGGSGLEISQNEIRDFSTHGVYFNSNFSEARTLIQANQIIGDGGALGGAFFNGPIELSSLVQIDSNCFKGAVDATRVDTILDISEVVIYQNDFTDTTVGVNNVNGDAAHTINAENNWWGSPDEPGTGGSVGVSGYVDYDPWLLSEPDVCLPEVLGDLDDDGDVDLADLAALLAAYGTCVGDPGYNPDADLDGDGCVDLADLAALLSNYGYGT